MKRLFAVITALLAVFASVACGKKDYCGLGAYLSELRTDYMVAECALGRVDVATGMRETPYEIDGVSREKESYTVITLTPASFTPNKVYRYTAVIGGAEYTGQMAMHPFGNSYSADIPAKSDERAVQISLSDETTSCDLTAESVLTDTMIRAERALEVAYAAQKTGYDAFKSGGKFNAEIYVRLIPNPIDNQGGYYWYVAACADTTVAALIDPNTEEIVAQRE